MRQNRKEMLGKIMNHAWEMAREGAKKFGGNAKLYFSCALKSAWSEVRASRLTKMQQESEPRTAWHLGIGNRYVLPGIPIPSSPIKKGQLSLPGICL